MRYYPDEDIQENYSDPFNESSNHSTNSKSQYKSSIKFETKGPIKIIKKPLKNNFDEPLIAFKLNNPFKRILHWLDDIRKKQTTTFDFKIKIPLIALPVFLAILGGAFTYFFNLGQQQVEKKDQKLQLTPTAVVTSNPSIEVLVSKVGEIKAAYQLKPTVVVPKQIIQISDEEISTQSSITNTPTPTTLPSRYLLVERYNVVNFIIAPGNMQLNSYLNQKVIITGYYNKNAKTLRINKVEDIEILP